MYTPLWLEFHEPETFNAQRGSILLSSEEKIQNIFCGSLEQVALGSQMSKPLVERDT